jgi:hypothetical protein
MNILGPMGFYGLTLIFNIFSLAILIEAFGI